jgi:tetratricopeptide (TPR) repeat protein
VTEREALAILRGADAAAAARAEAQLWEMWCRAGEPEIDALFARGVAAMEQGRFPDAEGIFTAIIVRAPDFAEGWNKRATLRYLARDFTGAIEDCRETLARKSRDAAAKFRGALDVHPHLDSVRQNLRLATAEAMKGNGHA